MGAIDSHFKVQVVSGAPAGAAYGANLLSAADGVSFAHIDRGHMGV